MRASVIIDGSTWTADYDYRKDGNIDSEAIAGTSADFDYDGDLMTDKGNDSLDWDLNGQMTSGITASMEWNWDGKLQSASAGEKSFGPNDVLELSAFYNPLITIGLFGGNRVHYTALKTTACPLLGEKSTFT